MQPEKIGRYEIKSELGRGGMATVYRGWDLLFEREVAVKVLPRELLHPDPQFKLRFEREAKIIASFEHPSIVPVYDVGEDDGQPYFVMRYMSGGSLSDRIKAKVMTVDETVKILAQIAPGMDEAHTKGIVHRDLKPSNILFDGKGTPYISDFGIAKLSQAQSGNMTGCAIIGTPAYMAPEQAQGTGVDGRTDIYALGIILFEMLTGKQPYEADTPMAVAFKHITDPVPDILASNPNLPKGVETIIQIAMAKDKEERFATAGELVDSLRAVASGKKLSREQAVIKGAVPKTAIKSGAPKTIKAGAKVEAAYSPKPHSGKQHAKPSEQKKAESNSASPTTAKPTEGPEPTASSETRIEIKPGDTLSSIAAKYHTTVEAILQANPEITNRNLIFESQVLKIPTQDVEKKSAAQAAERIFSERMSVERANAARVTERINNERINARIFSERMSAQRVNNYQHTTHRILNAGFASPNNQLLNSDTALSSNNFYDLLVDVGPHWKRSQSIVIESEKAYFPEEKLPTDQSGYQVRVVFVSEDFSPKLSTGEIWVPAKQGQCYPLVDGKRSEEPGPIRLRVRAPRLGVFKNQSRAYGRLCLYYKGQLIQSALVAVSIAKFQVKNLKELNRIDVDYVLSRNFDEPNRFSDRQVKFGEDESHPVTVGLTLNDDGSGRHRILATYHLNSNEETTVPPAWAPYDAQSAQQTLIEFRNVMAECYKGLNDNFGKNRKQFGYDMLELAKLGDRLRTLALSGLDVSSVGNTIALWRREFLNTLKTATVIQIARTGPANYVFPWALVYEYPLPGPKYELCKVIEEWGENGVRDKKAGMGCPYRDEDWHQENVICPYGFWGLKHIIEQPPGAIHKQDNHWVFDVTDKISVRNEFSFGVGLTNDIDQGVRDQHLNRLVTSMKAWLNPQQPAYNRKSVLAMLQAPEIVYFLCHGEVDVNQTPYLSIGEHVNNPDYKIFPNTLEQWSVSTSSGINLKLWQTIRPLVFINGCHTAQLQPGVVLNFVSAFADLGASGVIGTEVSVRADMAMAVGEAVLTRIGSGMEIGQAVREMRWEMLNRGNLLGLAYTPYSLANLRIERAS